MLHAGSVANVVAVEGNRQQVFITSKPKSAKHQERTRLVVLAWGEVRVDRLASAGLRVGSAWFPCALLVCLAMAQPSQAQPRMVTSADFAVTESGAATLSVPIQVPRGIGGMEPQLAFGYGSGGGNGLLGVGWSLSGISAISRCPRSVLHDRLRGSVNFDANDRFCLDGQRLVKVDPANPNQANPSQSGYGGTGSEYRTERDSFSRIRAVTSPNGSVPSFLPRGFMVETKAGLILEFGDVAPSPSPNNSQIYTKPSLASAGMPSTINRWMIRRIVDRNGSSVDFEYCAGEIVDLGSGTQCNTPAFAGSAPIQYIRYTNRGTSNGSLAVVFRYEVRPDVVEAFHAGTAARQTQRLAAVQTYIGFVSAASPGTLVRTYQLKYQPLEQGSASVRATTVSQLSSIVERGADGLALPALAFDIAPDAVMGQNVRQRAIASAALPTPSQANCGGAMANRTYLLCP